MVPHWWQDIRQRRRLLFLSVIATSLVIWQSREYRIAVELRSAIAEIQRAIETYAVNHEGSYPAALDDPELRALLPEWPRNPYTGRAIPVLMPDAAPLPGGLVYAPSGPIIYVGQEGQHKPSNSDIAGEVEERWASKLEIDSYAIFAYGRPSLWLKGKAKSMPSVPPRHEQGQLSRYSSVNRYLPLDWKSVVLVVTAGESL